jgi:hypothetical protein
MRAMPVPVHDHPIGRIHIEVDAIDIIHHACKKDASAVCLSSPLIVMLLHLLHPNGTPTGHFVLFHRRKSRSMVYSFNYTIQYLTIYIAKSFAVGCQ